MKISGQVLDKNSTRYGLPTDSCVGSGGPTPQQVTVISKSVGKSPAQKG
jgi:hypothetical protein